MVLKTGPWPVSPTDPPTPGPLQPCHPEPSLCSARASTAIPTKSSSKADLAAVHGQDLSPQSHSPCPSVPRSPALQFCVTLQPHCSFPSRFSLPSDPLLPRAVSFSLGPRHAMPQLRPASVFSVPSPVTADPGPEDEELRTTSLTITHMERQKLAGETCEIGHERLS